MISLQSTSAGLRSIISCGEQRGIDQVIFHGKASGKSGPSIMPLCHSKLPILAL